MTINRKQNFQNLLRIVIRDVQKAIKLLEMVEDRTDFSIMKASITKYLENALELMKSM